MMKNVFPVVTNNDFLFPDSVFNSFFNDFMKPATSSYTIPKVDIEDKGDSYVVTTDLPGVSKEDVTVTYDNDVLTLAAKHEDKKEENDGKKNYIRKERTDKAFCRQFTVQHIQKDGIQANFKDGVLTVVLPKEDPKKAAEAHKIEVK